MYKPFSEACERNKEPIFSCLKELLTQPALVLEIGSGTGQHAVYFAEKLPFIRWQTSDLPENHYAIESWITDSGLTNVLKPLAIDVCQDNWGINKADMAFTANTLHIMSWEHVECMFTGLGKILEEGSFLCIYGPFNYGGQYTSRSNEEFDLYLKNRNPLSGIRDFEDVEKVAKGNNFMLSNDYGMPANNRLLIFKR